MLKHVPGPFKIKMSQTDPGFSAAWTVCLTQKTNENNTDGGVVQMGW